mgnify:CR=1 FL=1
MKDFIKITELYTAGTFYIKKSEVQAIGPSCIYLMDGSKFEFIDKQKEIIKQMEEQNAEDNV